MSGFLVYAQVEDGQVHDVSLQCLVAARALAQAQGGQVAAVALGSGLDEAPRHLIAGGADEVLTVEDAALEHYLTAPYRRALNAVLEGRSFRACLFPATTEGDDLAPVLAAEREWPVVLDCDVCEPAAGGILTKRLEFDRKVLTAYRPTGEGALVVSLKDGAAAAAEPDPTRTGSVNSITADLGDTATSRIVRRDVVQKTINLKDARIIVGAGAGVGNEDHFGLVRQLAKRLGGEIGATRAVVDAGWLPADHQIGQTGATVKPDVYIACGISGAVQHKVGMSEAKKIVAVNLDKAAPIHKIAHFRVVGDLTAVIPKLLKLLG